MYGWILGIPHVMPISKLVCSVNLLRRPGVILAHSTGLNHAQKIDQRREKGKGRISRPGLKREVHQGNLIYNKTFPKYRIMSEQTRMETEFIFKENLDVPGVYYSYSPSPQYIANSS